MSEANNLNSVNQCHFYKTAQKIEAVENTLSLCSINTDWPPFQNKGNKF